MQEKSYGDFDVGFSERMVMVCEEAIDTFEATTQTAKAIEELSELIRSLSRVLQFEPDFENVKEEIADVLIMVCQMTLLFDFDDVQEVLNKKLQRLEWKIKKEKMANADVVRN